MASTFYHWAVFLVPVVLHSHPLPLVGSRVPWLMYFFQRHFVTLWGNLFSVSPERFFIWGSYYRSSKQCFDWYLVPSENTGFPLLFRIQYLLQASSAPLQHRLHWLFGNQWKRLVTMALVLVAKKLPSSHKPPPHLGLLWCRTQPQQTLPAISTVPL